jgi:endonuclease/exonuclease/phosphatase family metal-dependent hydrolase
MSAINVAWWNLENLFDEVGAARPPELAATLKNELKGWTVAVRDQKLDQLASIIPRMFNAAGPDLLGVAEAENETVLKLLANRLAKPGRDYRVLSHASPDARGIDVSFILDENKLAASNPGHQVVNKRRATRDLFWATFTVKANGAAFAAMANHWPSRSGGQYESEPFRMMTAETASYVVSRLLSPSGGDPNLAILLMGDFNDEPFNRSMQEYLLGLRDAEQVLNADSPEFLNLMWPLLSVEDPGTLRFDSTWNLLDQFLISKAMLKANAGVKVQPGSVAIFRPQAIRKSNGEPRRFGRPAEPGFDPDGFSDHFPITLTLEAT